MGIMGLSPGGKVARDEANHLTPSRPQVTHVWCDTSLPLYHHGIPNTPFILTANTYNDKDTGNNVPTTWPSLPGFTVWIRRCHLENLLLIRIIALLIKTTAHTVHAEKGKHSYSMHDTETQFFTHDEMLILLKYLCLTFTQTGSTLMQTNI
jgi:hypothetical protein